jgi:hypothetical protein
MVRGRIAGKGVDSSRGGIPVGSGVQGGGAVRKISPLVDVDSEGAVLAEPSIDSDGVSRVGLVPGEEASSSLTVCEGRLQDAGGGNGSIGGVPGGGGRGGVHVRSDGPLYTDDSSGNAGTSRAHYFAVVGVQVEDNTTTDDGVGSREGQETVVASLVDHSTDGGEVSKISSGVDITDASVIVTLGIPVGTKRRSGGCGEISVLRRTRTKIASPRLPRPAKRAQST